MAALDEDRLFGPRPELLGRVGLQVHDVLRGPEQDAPDAVALGHSAGIRVQRCRNGAEGGGPLLGRHVCAHSLREEGARPPEFLHREVGGTHVFISHGALAILSDERVWAVTGSGVEVLR